MTNCVVYFHSPAPFASEYLTDTKSERGAFHFEYPMPRPKRVRIKWAKQAMHAAQVAAMISGPLRYNSTTIAEEIGMTVRSVSRIISELRALGAPLAYRPGCYWLEFEREWDFWAALRTAIEREIARPSERKPGTRKKQAPVPDIGIDEDSTLRTTGVISGPADKSDAPGPDPAQVEIVEHEENEEEFDDEMIW